MIFSVEARSVDFVSFFIHKNRNLSLNTMQHLLYTPMCFMSIYCFDFVCCHTLRSTIFEDINVITAFVLYDLFNSCVKYGI